MKETFGPFNIRDENKKIIAASLVSTLQMKMIRQCPISHLNIDTDIAFYIQRDDSKSYSTFRYWRLDLQRVETFSFAPGYSDHTHVRYDGHNLTCVDRNRHHRCNNLPRGAAVPAVVISIDFNPRKGTAHRNQWSRNRYSLQGSYYWSKCKPMKEIVGPFNIRDESKTRIAASLVPTLQMETIKQCPISQLNIDTDIVFYIQRDDSVSSSTFRYWRLDLQRFETFSFLHGYSDHTNVRYDGHNLTCVDRNKNHQCNNLPRGTAVPAVVVSIEFNPRAGRAYRNQWSRNRYSLQGSYYQSSCSYL